MSTIDFLPGWIPDVPDHRDFVCAMAPPAGGLPAVVDLRGQCPPVVDQGRLGSCVANATAAAHQFEQLQLARSKAFAPSRLFLYFEARRLAGLVNVDRGCYIRDAFKVMAKAGVCPEKQWPYDVAQWKAKPADACYTEALKHQAVRYQRVDQRAADNIRAVLASGTLVVFGAQLYQTFIGDAVRRSGVVPMPGKGERAVGGHAMAIVGYDHGRSVFFVRNSWGIGWGKRGYCEMPYGYVCNDNLTADFWAVSLVET